MEQNRFPTKGISFFGVVLLEVWVVVLDIFCSFLPRFFGDDDPILTCAYFSKNGLKLNHQLK